MVKLIDLSSAQIPSSVDWTKVGAAGIEGVYLRCGEGIHSFDVAFSEHLKRARDAGVRTGAYYVMAPSTKDPTGSAHAAMDWAQDAEMPLCIDVERNRALGTDAPEWSDFLTSLTSLLSGHSVVYTYTSFLNELVHAGWMPGAVFQAEYHEVHYSTVAGEYLRQQCLGDMKAFSTAVLKGDAAAAKAAANARTRDAIALSKLDLDCEPTGKPPEALLWQWGGDANGATCPGVLGFCDRSTFYGDWDTWLRFPPLQTVEVTEALPVIAQPSLIERMMNVFHR